VLQLLAALLVLLLISKSPLRPMILALDASAISRSQDGQAAQRRLMRCSRSGVIACVCRSSVSASPHAGGQMHTDKPCSAASRRLRDDRKAKRAPAQVRG
jgi:hypothetical protein